MLDGLEISIVPLSQTLKNIDFRIDPEFHQKPPFKDKGLHKIVPIGEILESAQYGLSIDMNEEGIGYSIYRMNEMSNMLCSSYVAKYADISENEMRQFELEDRDVLFNRTNSQVFVGRTGLFKKFSDKPYVFASYLIRLKPDKKKVLPEYLTIFLNTKLGVWDVKRRARISINQSNVNAEEVKAVKIPLLSIDFQLKLKGLLDSAFKKLEQSKHLYAEAEETLLDELGLKNWSPPKESAAVKSFKESFGKSGRLDAEFYQPKYDDIYKRLGKTAEKKKWEVFSLGSISSPLKYGSSTKLEYVESGVPFLRIADLQQFRFDLDSVKYISSEAAQNEKQALVKTGDVLISRSGTLGLAIAIPENLDNSVFGSYFIRTRPNRKLLDPMYLALFINSLIGQMQVEQVNTGAIQTNLTIPVIESMTIVCPPIEKQREFVSQVVKSYEAQDESKRLLELSKRAVDVSIESGESAGMKVLEG